METPFEKTPIETGNPPQPELTPRQIYEEGKNLEQAGNKLGAAAQYEKAGYSHLAIRIYEESGDIARAYEIAKKSGDNFTADRLADAFNISGHEFSDFPPARGRDFKEVMSVALKSRLQEGATIERLGFTGFKDKVVVDVGTRDGRFVPLFRDLGAKEVFGIDPDSEALKEAVDKGILDEEHALPVKLQDLPEAMRGKFEVATIFNFNMPRTEQDGFFQQLYENLPEGAQIIMTFAEDEILENAIPIMQKYFIVRSTKLWQKEEDYPHKNLVVLRKKFLEDSAEIQKEITTRLEEWAGVKFRGHIVFSSSDLTIKDDDFNPEGEMGALGTFDYANRRVVLDLHRIRKTKSYTPTDAAEHEALHILERDSLNGRAPIHNHLMHAVYFGQSEQQRVLKRAYAVTDERVRKLLFNKDIDIAIDLDQKNLRKTIEKIENALQRKKASELDQKEQVVMALVAMNLSDIKTVYFAQNLNDPGLVIEFLKRVESLKPWGSFIEQEVYHFEEENTIIESLIAENPEKRDKTSKIK